jgi:hypothetical protein
MYLQRVFLPDPSILPLTDCGHVIDRMEETMLKHVTILGALRALGTAPVAAQQQEAVLQRMRVADFDVVFAIPKSPPRMLDDLNMSRDALIMHLTLRCNMRVPFG